MVMYVVFFVVLLLLTLLIFPLRMRAIGYFNITHDQVGCITVKLFGLKLFSFKIQIENNMLYMFTKKGKKRIVKIIKENDDEVSIIDYFDNTFIAVANIKIFDYYITAGFGNDAFATAILTAIIKVLGVAATAVLSRHYPQMKNTHDVQPDFENECFRAGFNAVVGLNLISIFYAVYYAFFKTIRKNDKTLKKKKAIEAKEKAKSIKAV